MKLFFLYLSLVLAFGSILLPQVSMASAGDAVSLTVLQKCGEQDGGCTWTDAVNFINQAIDFLLYLALTMAVISITYAGFLFVTAMGDSGKISQGKKVFGKVIWGLIISFAAWLIVHFILVQLGVLNGYTLLKSS